MPQINELTVSVFFIMFGVSLLFVVLYFKTYYKLKIVILQREKLIKKIESIKPENLASEVLDLIFSPKVLELIDTKRQDLKAEIEKEIIPQ